jgi:hypothetical protein
MASIWAAPWWVWALAFLLCFAVAQFLAWHEEYRASAALEAELHDQHEPQLDGQIVQVNHHNPPTELAAQGYSCSVVIVVEIANAGVDSMVDAFRLTLTADGREIAGDIVAFPNTMTLEGNYGAIQYFGSDALYRKTLTPIPRGGKVVGVLWDLFRGINPTDFDSKTLTLHFSDVRRKQWSVKVPSGDLGRGTPHFFPGIRLGLPGPLKGVDSQSDRA